MSWEPRYTKIQKHRLAQLVGKRLVERYIGRVHYYGTIKKIVAERADQYVVHFDGTEDTVTLYGGGAHQLVRKGRTSSTYTHDENGREVRVLLKIEEKIL